MLKKFKIAILLTLVPIVLYAAIRSIPSNIATSASDAIGDLGARSLVVSHIRGSLSPYTKVGTTITAIFSDGSTVKFVYTCATCSAAAGIIIIEGSETAPTSSNDGESDSSSSGGGGGSSSGGGWFGGSSPWPGVVYVAPRYGRIIDCQQTPSECSGPGDETAMF